MGFAMACVFATFYAVATKAVPEQANGVAGLMIMAIAAGAVSGPVCGAIIRWTGNPTWGCCSSPSAWVICSGQVSS